MTKEDAKLARKCLKEYNAGYDSGLLHDPSDPLCRANERKMQTGVKSDAPFVRAYWQGYYDAVNKFFRNPSYCHKTQVAFPE